MRISGIVWIELSEWPLGAGITCTPFSPKNYVSFDGMLNWTLNASDNAAFGNQTNDTLCGPAFGGPGVAMIRSHDLVLEIGVAAFKPLDILDQDVEHVILVAPGLSAGMRGQQHILQSPKR